MTEKRPLKLEGIKFGRALQSALKVSVMYSVDHPAAERALQQAYASLEALVKQTPRFTLGFLNHRLLINDLLTDDESLNQLQVEFLKRGIGAVSFLPGTTLEEFKRALALLSTNPKIVEEKGGIAAILESNPLQSVRVLPGAKQSGGDTVLEADPESYLMGQGLRNSQSQSGLQELETLLQSIGFEKSQGKVEGTGQVLELADKATQAVLADRDVDPGKLVKALAKILEEVSPEKLLATLPAGQQRELADRPASDVACELMEGFVTRWAAKRLANPPAGSEAAAVEQEVVRALIRGFKATAVLERLLRKLAQVLEEAKLPPEVYERIRRELMWYALSQDEKQSQLMGLEQFSPEEFRRLVHFVQDSMKEGRFDRATQVAGHYFDLLKVPGGKAGSEELARAADLVGVVASPKTLYFLKRIAEPFARDLEGEKTFDPESHQGRVACLVRAAQSAARSEEFELALRTGSELERSRARDRDKHQVCCGQGLENLLSPESLDRLTELYVEKRDDAAWNRAVATLLKWAGPAGSEHVFQHLEKEAAAPNRMRLLRLFVTLGPAGIAGARKRLADERWYVVRNACYVLGDLGDPELSAHLQGSLRHPEARVQQAALIALIKSHAENRAETIADALTDLHPNVFRIGLEELTFLKDPRSIRAGSPSSYPVARGAGPWSWRRLS